MKDSILKRERIRLGLTQQQLVDLCKFKGITQSRIAEWEAGIKRPSISQALVIARALKLSGSKMLNWMDYKTKV